MCAKARDELRRPGFNGGGGGNPFGDGAARTTTAAAGGTVAAIFLAVAGGKLALTAFSGALADAFIGLFGTLLGAGLGAALAVALVAAGEADFAFITVLDTALLIAFGTDLLEGLTVDFLGCGLTTGNFFAVAAFAAGLTLFLIARAGLALTALMAFGEGLASLTDATVLAGTLTLDLIGGLAATFALPVGAATGFLTGLAATLAVVLSFFVCAFTAYLLWQAAPG